MSEGFGVNREFKQYIPIEGLVASQINRIMEYRSKKLVENFEESIDALVDLLAPDDEEKAVEYKHEHKVFYDVSQAGKERYVLYFQYVKRLLYDKNVVWKRGSGYQVGHD